MTSVQVVETSINFITNSPSQDYAHPDDHTSPTCDKTSGFKPLTMIPVLLMVNDTKEYPLSKLVKSTKNSTF